MTIIVVYIIIKIKWDDNKKKKFRSMEEIKN